jgi:hypothetical protein
MSDELEALLTKHGVKPPLWSGIGKGWLRLVEVLIIDLVWLGWDKDLHQIKEKFGGLRFYIGATGEGIHERIMAAESESFKVCEDCGAAGEPRKGGWIRTLCDACDVVSKEAERKRWAK